MKLTLQKMLDSKINEMKDEYSPLVEKWRTEDISRQMVYWYNKYILQEILLEMSHNDYFNVEDMAHFKKLFESLTPASQDKE